MGHKNVSDDDNGGEVLGGEGGGVGVQKNQICHHRHHWDKGGREDLMIATPGRDDTHANSTT